MMQKQQRKKSKQEHTKIVLNPESIFQSLAVSHKLNACVVTQVELSQFASQYLEGSDLSLI